MKLTGTNNSIGLIVISVKPMRGDEVVVMQGFALSDNVFINYPSC
jgi:hypothetical protein